MAQHALLDREEAQSSRNEFLHDLTDLHVTSQDADVLARRDHLTVIRYAAPPSEEAGVARPLPAPRPHWYDFGVAALILTSGASALACLLTLGH